MPEFALQIGIYEIVGWQSVQIQRSLDTVADSFNVALSSPFSSAATQVSIREGDPVEVTYDGILVLSGYIDEVDENSDATTFTLAISGRSKAKDLIDCSAIHKGAWRNKPLDVIIEDIAEPFGILVATDLGLEMPIERSFRLQDGEKCWDAIERLVSDYGCRVVSRPDGTLVLTRTGRRVYPDVVIERGVNVVSGGVKRTENERYSQYIFKASAAADDANYGADAVAAFALEDEGVSRYRPLVVHKEGKGGKLQSVLKQAASWERNTRAGKAQTLSYRVLTPGDPARSWEMPNGHGLWAPNLVVAVRDPNHIVDGLFLITSVTLARSNAGTTTQLELTHPEAYEPEKPPKKKGKKKGYTW